MERVTRFERATSSLARKCSTTELHPQKAGRNSESCWPSCKAIFWDFIIREVEVDRAGFFAMDQCMSASIAAQLLREVLDQKRRRGQTHVQVTQEDLGKLARVRTQEGGRAAAVRAEERAELSRMEEPPKNMPSSPVIPLSGGTKEEKLAQLAGMAEEATAPRALGSLRDAMVFAVGNPDAEVMLVGEAPGYEEERQSEPFVGPAGQRLTKILKAMGLERRDVYISNICKFRPAINGGENQGTRNRAPTKEEMEACLPFVWAEIEVIQPKVIIALGKTAAEGLGIEGSVGEMRGQFHEVRGIPTMVTYHPSYILRSENDPDGGRSAKAKVWSDMLQVMEHVGMSISAKQRGYFK